MTVTYNNNTIQSPPPKRRKLSVTMSSSSKPSLQPSALDRTRSLRKPTSTARLMKETSSTGASGTSAGSSTTTRGAGIGAPKQRPVPMIQVPSTTKGGLPAPGTISRTVPTSSVGTAISGGGIKRMASVAATRSGTDNSNIKPPASGGLDRLASTRLKREGGKVENAGVGAGSGVGTGISSGPGNRVGSGAATTSTITTKSTTSSVSGLRQPLRARAPTVSASSMTAKATPLSPPTTTARSLSGPFGMTRPTTSPSGGSLATISSPRATATSGSGTRIGTGIGLGGRGHARTQSATISSPNSSTPKPTTPKPVPRSTAASGPLATGSSKSTIGKDAAISRAGSGSESPKSASKGVPPPSTPGKSKPQSLISTTALRRSPATATPKIATTGGTSKTSPGTGLGSSPAHKRQNSASSISTAGTATTTGTKARTAANTGTATSTATTQSRHLAASRRPLSMQAPKPVTGIYKAAPTATSSTTRPTATATTTTVTKPALRKPATALSSSTTTTTKASAPKPKSHIPEPPAPEQQQHPRHDFDTYQQHYTPTKIPLAPKPLTSSFLAPPTPSKQPANMAASAENSRLQTELLQLHLLHRDAERVRGEWEGDAERKLREKWERVRREHEVVGELEAREGEEGVMESLLQLGLAGDGLEGRGMLDEQKIQALDEVILGAWAMSEPSFSSSYSSSSGATMGKYTRVVLGFEVWAERARRILEDRRRSTEDKEGGDGGLKLDENGEVEMIGGLDVEWKNECVALGRRLEEWRRVLGEVGRVSLELPGYGSFRASRSIRGVKDVEKETNDREEEEEDKSPLDRILSGFGSLVDNMLAELEVMEQIEREGVAEESEWVRRMNRVGEEEDEEEGGETGGKRGEAIWRAF
ncbi:hypothetical protein QBC45DRAFT_37897 [Copromyces sp. CBS 386.78]|nr:hypothetical protein QBC45DRAFT_37897 [Copromyces sp. CBS 386.78]